MRRNSKAYIFAEFVSGARFCSPQFSDLMREKFDLGGEAAWFLYWHSEVQVKKRIGSEGSHPPDSLIAQRRRHELCDWADLATACTRQRRLTSESRRLTHTCSLLGDT